MNRILERATWGRPFGIALGGVAAALVTPGLRDGSLLAWVMSAFFVTTLSMAALSRVGRLAGFGVGASILYGLLGWGFFATFTGGLTSPFIAAFLLEIVIAGLAMGRRGVAAVTAGVLVVMVGISGLYGFSRLGLLATEVVFVVATGIASASVARRRAEGEAALRSQGEELGQRLELIQRELEDERVVSRVGENVARLAHGLKNAVHSLRGFVSLIEPQLEQGAGSNAAIAGLHAAIDDLEKLARLTLDSPAEAQGDSAGASEALRATGPTASLAETVAAARREVEGASPGVLWTVREASGGGAARVALSEDSLLELLVILMRNGVEAMEGEGEASVDYRVEENCGVVVVEDAGPGFPSEFIEQELQPGNTTKPKGSGFGLFLGRRIVEDQGGRLTLGNRAEGGASVRVEIPLADMIQEQGRGA